MKLEDILNFPSHLLEDIKKNCHYTDHRSQMVELWRRVDHEGFSWVNLQSALKQLFINRRQRMESSTSSDNFPLSLKSQFRIFHTGIASVIINLLYVSNVLLSLI